MKKASIVLLLALLLSGCAKKKPEVSGHNMLDFYMLSPGKKVSPKFAEAKITFITANGEEIPCNDPDWKAHPAECQIPNGSVRVKLYLTLNADDKEFPK